MLHACDLITPNVFHIYRFYHSRGDNWGSVKFVQNFNAGPFSKTMRPYFFKICCNAIIPRVLHEHIVFSDLDLQTYCRVSVQVNWAVSISEKLLIWRRWHFCIFITHTKSISHNYIGLMGRLRFQGEKITHFKNILETLHFIFEDNGTKFLQIYIII